MNNRFRILFAVYDLRADANGMIFTLDRIFAYPNDGSWQGYTKENGWRNARSQCDAILISLRDYHAK